MFDGVSPWIGRLLGSVVGGFTAIVFLPPKTVPEFYRRCTVSLVFGIIMAEPVRNRLELDNTMEMFFSSAALSACFSWWFIQFIINKLESKIPEDGGQ